MSKPPGTTIARTGDLRIRDLSLDLAQIVFDIAGIVDPTPICDGTNTIISVARGDWLGAGLSAAGMIPYVGDLAKAGKFPKYLKTVELVIRLAVESAEAARIFAPLMQRLDNALDLLPAGSSPQLRQLQQLVSDYVTQAGLKVTKHVLPDISGQFVFRKFRRNGYEYHVGKGRLGVPGKVRKHRSRSAQRSVSSGTGDDAGHLIGNRFGAPGGVENLGPQNWIANRNGTFRHLENRWAQKLKSGTGAEVTVMDIAKQGETRPFARRVTWQEISPQGHITHHELTFVNPHSPRSRTRQQIPETVSGPQSGNVIEVDFATGQRR